MPLLFVSGLRRRHGGVKSIWHNGISSIPQTGNPYLSLCCCSISASGHNNEKEKGEKAEEKAKAAAGKLNKMVCHNARARQQLSMFHRRAGSENSLSAAGTCSCLFLCAHRTRAARARAHTHTHNEKEGEQTLRRRARRAARAGAWRVTRGGIIIALCSLWRMHGASGVKKEEGKRKIYRTTLIARDLHQYLLVTSKQNIIIVIHLSS